MNRGGPKARGGWALEKITEGSVRSSISEQQQPLPSFAYCLRAATVGSATGRPLSLPLPPPLSRLRSHKEIAAGSDDLTKKLQRQSLHNNNGYKEERRSGS
ncbi:hypothetical protein L1987_78032 [Smallanthus sonchifolius]|uniref:Uncharacterized protein n=1 Tax=Smallanthus sonchifolius TaxID=185202 RepID=A0ACB8ZBJ7_9ASTR|nr:hypothetical protein L1987_78032 [Smallanthus sonchifolius]